MSAEQAADASKVDASEDMSELEIEYMQYSSEELLQGIIDLIALDLSEPYSIFTYRYLFLRNLVFLGSP